MIPQSLLSKEGRAKLPSYIVVLISMFVYTFALGNTPNGFKVLSDFGAIGDGMTDDTEAFAAAVKSGSPLYLEKGSYRITKPIKIRRGLVLKMDAGAEIVWDNLATNISLFDVSSNISVSGGAVVGKWKYTDNFETLVSSGNRVRNNFFYIHNNGSLAIDTIKFSGVQFRGSSDYCIRVKSYSGGKSITNFRVENCSFKKNYAGVQIDNLGSLLYFERVLFSNNAFNGTATPKLRSKEALGGNAINILGGTKNVTVTGNRFENVGRMCLEFITANRWDENKAYRPINTIIENNYLGQALYRTFSVVGYSVSVRGNTIITDSKDYIEFRGADFLFENNIIKGGGILSRGELYKDNDLRSLRVIGNKFYDLNAQAHVVDVKFYKDVVIEGNVFSLANNGKPSRATVNAYRCDRIKVLQNQFIIKNLFNGIPMSIVDCSHGRVANNQFEVLVSKKNQIRALYRFSKLINFDVLGNKVHAPSHLKLQMSHSQANESCTNCSNVLFKNNDFCI